MSVAVAFASIVYVFPEDEVEILTASVVTKESMSTFIQHRVCKHTFAHTRASFSTGCACTRADTNTDCQCGHNTQLLSVHMNIKTIGLPMWSQQSITGCA